MRITMNYDGSNFEIDGITIDDSIFQELGYTLVDREQQIEDLYRWIAETKSEEDKLAMKEDLHYLEDLEDEFVLSSLSTNEFIAKSDNEGEFNNLCRKILSLNNIKK